MGIYKQTKAPQYLFIDSHDNKHCWNRGGMGPAPEVPQMQAVLHHFLFVFVVIVFVVVLNS